MPTPEHARCAEACPLPLQRIHLIWLTEYLSTVDAPNDPPSRVTHAAHYILVAVPATITLLRVRPISEFMHLPLTTSGEDPTHSPQLSRLARPQTLLGRRQPNPRSNLERTRIDSGRGQYCGWEQLRYCRRQMAMEPSVSGSPDIVCPVSILRPRVRLDG